MAFVSTTRLSEANRAPLRGVAGWGSACGIAGLIANVLLIVFFALGAPYGLALAAFEWSGSANDVMVAVQFGLFVPVATGLARCLPRSAAMRVATTVGVTAMAGVVVLQVALVVGVLEFDVQVRLVLPMMSLVFVWLLVLCSTAHRSRLLPRPLTRLGLLVGAAFLVGIVLYAASALLARGSVAQGVLLVPGIVLGTVGWLGLPLWPLLLARSADKS